MGRKQKLTMKEVYQIYLDTYNKQKANLAKSGYSPVIPRRRMVQFEAQLEALKDSYRERGINYPSASKLAIRMANDDVYMYGRNESTRLAKALNENLGLSLSINDVRANWLNVLTDEQLEEYKRDYTGLYHKLRERGLTGKEAGFAISQLYFGSL